MNDNMFSQMDFGPAQKYLDDDDVTDLSYSNGGQVWLKTLSKGIYRIEDPEINNTFMEKLSLVLLYFLLLLKYIRISFSAHLAA